jgi:hypothetical protein
VGAVLCVSDGAKIAKAIVASVHGDVVNFVRVNTIDHFVDDPMGLVAVAQ